MTAVDRRGGGRPSDVGTDAPGDARSAVGRWWHRTGPVKRVVVVLLAGVVGLNVVLAALDSAIGRDPGGPTGSSLSTGPDGVAAWADLLRARGVDVTALRTPLGETALDPSTTLVVVEPEGAPTADDLAMVAAHVAAGGRVVAVGRSASDHVVAATGLDPGWSDGGPAAPTTRPGAASDVGGARVLATEGHGRFVTVDGFRVLVAGDDGATVVSRGVLVAVADPSVVRNSHLARGDNAAAALGIAGPGPVAFAEAEHGYGEASGLAALPTRWKLAAAALVVATLLGMWSAGQRLGPPERPDRPRPPPRRAYVEALAAAVARARPAPDTEPRRGSP